MHVSADILPRAWSRRMLTFGARSTLPRPGMLAPRSASGEARSALANASLPSTLSEPTIAREEAGDEQRLPRITTPSLTPVAAQLIAQGSRTAVRSRRLRSIPGDRGLPTLTWKRSSELGTPSSSSDGTCPTASARLPHLLAGQARRADETIAVGEQSERHVARGAARRGGAARSRCAKSCGCRPLRSARVYSAVCDGVHGVETEPRRAPARELGLLLAPRRERDVEISGLGGGNRRDSPAAGPRARPRRGPSGTGCRTPCGAP